MTTSDPEIIGVKNGIYQCEIIPKSFLNSEAYNILESQFRFTSYELNKYQAPAENFEFEYVKFLKKAKVTDVISYSPKLVEFQFIISTKAKAVLDQLNLPNCRFYKTSLFDSRGDKVPNNFFMLQMTYSDVDVINFRKSSFYRGSDILGKKYLNINNYQEFQQEKEIDALISVEHISLKKEMIKSDLILSPVGGLFASERLWDKWSDLRITGIKVFERQTASVE
ncbi:hypothetical protein [Desertivirga brevis]|uniref:hypothetical protein n=1 Tax=Desertivirga brevis TaxID=2810310 RepID=UPI001A96CAF3|nr:hypothetical protein [Pedobacter sp. SYSU D00873]